MNDVLALTGRLESVFRRIQRERMVDVPIVNPELKVQAVGFQEQESVFLGVLITPWFMNLMLIPAHGEAWHDLPPGAKIIHEFPSGHYEFIVGEEEAIGRYQMCSLFSPVFEFEDQAAAVATAEAVMENLMNEACRDEVSTREQEIQKIWHGETVPEEEGAVASEEELPETTLRERIEKPMSRRDMLRGAFLRGTE